MNEKTRLENILSTLSHTYPHAHIALTYKTPWELLVAVILSAQCTDVMVNKITPALFKKYPDIHSFANAKQEDVEKLVHATGFFRNKTKSIIAAAKHILTHWSGEVPKSMEDMLTVPGVARKTANVVLGNAYGIVDGIAVDTHVIRLSQRLRLVPLDKIGGASIGIHLIPSSKTHTIDFYKDASPVKIETYLMAMLPKNKWMTITYQLIDHGRAICKAQHPTCDICPLSSYCPSKR